MTNRVSDLSMANLFDYWLDHPVDFPAVLCNGNHGLDTIVMASTRAAQRKVASVLEYAFTQEAFGFEIESIFSGCNEWHRKDARLFSLYKYRKPSSLLAFAENQVARGTCGMIDRKHMYRKCTKIKHANQIYVVEALRK
jgi:hypothetical protein